MDREAAATMADRINATAARCGGVRSKNGPGVRIMEVCGTHTVALFRTGLKDLIAEHVTLISGPGCPVCVTSQGYLDAACELAERDDVTICTYGDIVRVPGTRGSLGEMRSAGADVMVVYSARDALAHAIANPDRQVVFLAVGFETTTPPTALTLLEAAAKNISNFTVLPAHKLVVPAMAALLAAGEVPIDGFLCPGHVSIIIGANAYRPLVDDYAKPCVVAGFEPMQMLAGIEAIVNQLAAGQARVDNVYGVAVTDQGNAPAREFMDKVFAPGDAVWRAIGTIPQSGLELRDQFKRFDARERFGVVEGPDVCPPGCLCGDVIQGKLTPAECGLFGTTCTPIRPVGPCMVSSEGACAAWYKYGRPAHA